MLSMIWKPEAMAGDVEVVDGALVGDGSLRTPILVSLFTDRRAEADDELPAGSDRRGWVGDALADIEGDRIGSRLWLLKRRKQTEATRRDAEDYCREALEWMVEDGIATTIDVSAEWVSRGVLGCLMDIALADGSRERFTYMVAAGGV